MSTLNLNKVNEVTDSSVSITGSKSETNRLLILQALFPNISIDNISNSDDSNLLKKALLSKENTINIGHAGTAMRFLTAYFSVQMNRTVVLTGSERMKNRPIKILVEALRELGVSIEYLEKEGYPPIRIKGTTIKKDTIIIDGNVSSQYISALLLIASKLENGLTIQFRGKLTSVPYIKMTMSLLEELGVQYNWLHNGIKIERLVTIKQQRFIVESDWSSASYFYSFVALSNHSKIHLSFYKKNSLQGDSVLAEIYKNFGVTTIFNNNSIVISKEQSFKIPKSIKLNLVDSPDIAQTIAVTCFGLGIECELLGLHTLKIKETDRLIALKNEIEKLGGNITITEESLHLQASSNINSKITIKTYDDHRMAMAFAPLALKTSIRIEDPDVVSKSYPDFWNDFKKITT